jgi:membrane dipeptidase
MPIFDGHNDTLTDLQARSFFEDGAPAQLDLPKARRGGMIGGFYAIFAPPPPDTPESDPYYGLTITEDGYDQKLASAVDPAHARAYTDAVIGTLREIEREGVGQVGVVREYADLERNLERGVHSILLHFEDAAAIKADLSNLEDYYAQGLRSLGLVWSRPNAFGHGVPFRFPHSPDTGPGLTDAGKELVRACNRMGILLDLAHLNERGFWDVAQITDSPLVVTHTAVYEICPSTRNLTDEQIDAVGQTNGVIGVIFEPMNLRRDGQPADDTPLDAIVQHIDYIAQRIGVDHVAFGSDFDGADMPAALGDAAGLPRLVDALRDHGFNADAVEKITCRNWFRVLRQTWHD